MQRPGWQFALIVLVAAVALFTNLGGPRLWDRDEPRNAGCAAEMLARNDWVVPTFNQELRDAKPVLLYWLIMSAYSVFGVTEFAARFWSAALGFGTVLATYAIANRLFNRQVALLAAIILSTSTMFEVASRAATPDAPLIFCGTMALMILCWGRFGRETQPSNGPLPNHGCQVGIFQRITWRLLRCTPRWELEFSPKAQSVSSCPRPSSACSC